MSTGDGYARVYYSILTDPKFDRVYEDDHHLATWLRLLLTADQMWPTPAALPGSIRPASLRLLVEVGLVDLMPKHSYRIHGLDGERMGRSHAARNAAAMRWHPDAGMQNGPDAGSEGNAPAMRPHPDAGMPNDASPSPSPRPRPRPRPTRGASQVGMPAEGVSKGDADDGEMEVVAWLARHGCALSETNGLRRTVITLVDTFGANAVIGKLDRLSEAGMLDGDAGGFVFGARDALYPKPDMKALDREERAEDEAAAFNRRVEQTQRQMRALYGEER